jgi:hypothetical protein
LKKPRKIRHAERIGAVVRFIRANPLSTSEEIFKATGFGPMIATKYIKSVKYGSGRAWRLNHAKINEGYAA